VSGRRFVGFGLGAIQTGLFLYEAQAPGTFSSFTVAEVDRKLLAQVRGVGGELRVNIAHEDRVERAVLRGVEVLDPNDPSDAVRLEQAVREADELATAVPSVSLYEAGGPASIAAVLARSLDASRPRVLYAAENHNHAARLLTEAITRLRGGPAPRFQALETVIGKMSGVVTDPAEIESLGLASLVPGLDRAVLVEAFNRILVSRVALPGFQRGIAVFEEKPDLLPFEEAKLYGHNAVHALLGYLGLHRGYTLMSEVLEDSELRELGVRAFLEESGGALRARHGASGEALFTEAGYRDYALDLVRRMGNPFLRDHVARVCRDPRRKLGYDDRLVGTMRLALEAGIVPRLFAVGARAALSALATAEGRAGGLDARGIRDMLLAIWSDAATDEHAETCVELIAAAGLL
jgi:mannitol-1-phosphate 5-dehydrogenase